jgi:Uma2 family endonuclease
MMPLTTKPLPGTVWDPLYPDSDGRPMGETDFHAVAQVWLRQALEDFFAAVLDVYVATNLLFYYERGNPSGRRDPDVLVAKRVGKHRRRSYRLWEEGVVPCTLFEIASENTWEMDLNEKPELYARLRVPEYFLFDPEGRFLDPVLQGFRCRGGVPVGVKPNADGSLTSRHLGLRLVPEGAMLRLVDVRTGQRVPTRAERAEQAEEQAAQLAAEVVRLRAELARRRKPRG